MTFLSKEWSDDGTYTEEWIFLFESMTDTCETERS